MASLPSVAVNGSINKLESELRKLTPNSPPQDKSISYQRERSSEWAAPPLGDFREALSILKQVARVDSALYVPLLQECVDRDSLPETRILHAHMIKTGAHQDLFLSTSLVNVYMKCGSAEDARKLFDQLPRRNIVTWTALITGYAHNSQPDQSIKVFVRLLESGAYPTNYTFGAVLSACCSFCSVGFGSQVHGYAVKYQIDGDTSVGNSLCAFYAKCGSLDSAVNAFREIPDKNVISWTTIISACGDNGEAELGLRLFVDMLLESEMMPNEFTLTSALSLCCTVQALLLGEQIHSLCIKYGCESNLPVRNSIMYLYLKCGQIDEARRLFDAMDTVSLITWNAMIAGHAQMIDLARDTVISHCCGVEALKMFQKLNQSRQLKPDLFSFSSVLTVCSGLAALEQGEQIHAQTIKTGYLSDVVVGSALVNMYSKCGGIEQAIKAFVEMNSRTLISWTSMITGYSQHGRSEEAIRLFEDMRLAGVRPNQVTFVGVLSACSRSGMVEEAQYYLKMMKSEYGIKPVMDHYACMVDMFVRLGMLDEALEFIKRMDFEPNEIIWSILIAGCRSQGKMELAFYAADRLLELRPKGTETFILLLNMYISAERWHDVSRVRKLMKEEKIGILKDWSWISIKNRVYSFRADDRSHPQTLEMYELLANLLEKAKGLGYVAYKSFEISSEDEEKQITFPAHHSERLAIAFGLINTSGGSPVRVVKNMGMCRDCHSSTKFFSVLTQREIIVRDSKRLHRFRNGQCSCGDFASLL